MTTAYDRILDALHSCGSKVRTGERKASAQCPAHEDRDPSLSVRRIEGQALIYCHGGCDTDDVLAALNLSTRDLFDEPKGATYTYGDGRVVHRSPEKKFRQSGTTKGTAQLYKLDAVKTALSNGHPVYVVEGEKDVHALESIGAFATCSPMGAGKWGKVDSRPLHGGDIVVVADKDGPGEKHARDVVASLDGMAQSVTVVHATVGKDAADHVAAGYGLDDFVPHELDESDPALRRPRITWASEIEPKPVVWAWKEGECGRIPAGSLSVAAGREGTGKSSFAIWLAAHITRGTLPGSYFGQPRRVFYVAVEDSWEHTLTPRLIAAGADLSKVGRFDIVNYDDDEIMLSLPHDNALLEAAIVEHSVALVVVDPLLSVIGEKINTHQSREVRSALDPLARIADRTNSVLMGIAHFNKAAGTDASSLITGSGAFKDVPRSVFGFARDDSAEDGGRVMTQTKNSLGPDDHPSLAYAIEQAMIETKFGTAITSLFTFTGESDRTVSDVLRENRGGDEDKTERDEAAEWLVDFLTENGGEAKAGDAIKAAAGHGIAKTTLTRARQRAGVTSVKSGMGGGWVWSLESRRIHEEAEESRTQKVVPSVPSVDSSEAEDTNEVLFGRAECSVCEQKLLIDRGNGVCGRCDPTPIQLHEARAI